MGVSTPPDWHENILAQFRYPGHAKVVFDLIPGITTADTLLSAPSTHYLSDIEVIKQDVLPEYEPVATLEGTWKANGQMYLLSDDPAENLEQPWWADDVGVSPVTPADVTIELPAATKLAGLTIDWDTMFNAWPTHLIVVGLNNAFEPVGDYTFTNIQTTHSVLDCGFDSVSYIVLLIAGWSIPTARPRITSVTLGVVLTIEDSNINRIEDLTKISPINESLPTSIMTLYLRNLIYFRKLAIVDEISSERSHSATNISRILNGVAQTGGPVATMEVNYWKLDGTRKLLTPMAFLNYYDPWMSDTAVISSENPIEIIATFAGETFINRLRITWDKDTGSWPTSFELVGMQYNEEVLIKQYTGRSIESDIRDFVGYFDELRVIIYGWSVDGWRARITQMEIMYTYGNSYLPSEVNNLFDPTFAQGYSRFLAERQKLKVYFGQELTPGTVSWLEPQIRFLKTWTIPSDSLEAIFEATTRLSMLTSIYVFGTYSATLRTFAELAAEVLENADVIADDDNPEPWTIPLTMDVLSTSAPLPALEANALLQLIAQASGHLLHSHPETDYIEFVEAESAVGYTLDRRSLLGNPHIMLENPLRSLIVNVYTYTPAGGTSEVYKGSVYLVGQSTVRVKYDNDAIVSNPSAMILGGATISHADYYAQYADLLIDGGAGTVATITITGYVVSKSSTGIQYYHNTAVASGMDVTVDNPLITSVEIAEVVANDLLAYYANRRRVSHRYLGAPDIKAGDVCELTTEYTSDTSFILEHLLKYNGGYDGNITTMQRWEES